MAVSRIKTELAELDRDQVWDRAECGSHDVTMGWSRREGQLMVMLIVDFDLDR